MLAELTAFGLPINEFYGSSETIIVKCSPPDRIRLGTIGTPLAGVRLRLGPDEEILIAGPTITPGYFRDAERTAEALEPGGWCHTGDIGALDDDGYLRIVDREKALIINSFGKNMSPANIEQAIKGGQPLIAQVLDHDWPLGGQQLTPTAKVKRGEVTAQYQAVIDDLYDREA